MNVPRYTSGMKVEDYLTQLSAALNNPRLNDLLNGTSSQAAAQTTTSFVAPRMTTGQRDALVGPAYGMVIYNTSTNKLNVYTTAWEAVTSA